MSRKVSWRVLLTSGLCRHAHMHTQLLECRGLSRVGDPNGPAFLPHSSCVSSWLMVGAPSPSEELFPAAALCCSSEAHTCCFLSFSWVRLSTHPPATQGRTALGQGPLLSPRAVKGWALALLQLLGAQEERIKGRPCGPPLSSPSFKEVQTNPVPMPGSAAARCLQPQPVPPQHLLSPRKKTGPQSWSRGTPRTPSTGGASNARQGPLCSQGEVCQVGPR